MHLFFFYILLYIRLYAIAKIIIEDKGISRKEVIYVLSTGLVLVMVHVATVNITGDAHLQNMIILPMLFSAPFVGLFLYAYKNYSGKAAFILTTVSVFVVTVTDYLLTRVTPSLQYGYIISLEMVAPQEGFLMTLILLYAVSIPLAFLMRLFAGRLQTKAAFLYVFYTSFSVTNRIGGDDSYQM